MAKKGCLASIVGPLLIVGGAGYFCTTEEQRNNPWESICNVVGSVTGQGEEADMREIAKASTRWKMFEGEINAAVNSAAAGIFDVWRKSNVGEANIQRVSQKMSEEKFDESADVKSLSKSVDDVFARAKITKKDIEGVDGKMDKILQAISRNVEVAMRKELLKDPKTEKTGADGSGPGSQGVPGAFDARKFLVGKFGEEGLKKKIAEAGVSEEKYFEIINILQDKNINLERLVP